MTKQEFSKIAMAIKTYYPNAQILPNNAAMELWYQQLQDIPYNVCTLAVNKWVAINKWSPTIADIREYAAGIRRQESDWSEAWEELMKNIQIYGFYRVAEGKKALSDLTRKTVERIGYVHICNSENIIADRANFRDIYNSLLAREKKQAVLSAGLQAAIETVKQKSIEMKGETL